MESDDGDLVKSISRAVSRGHIVEVRSSLFLYDPKLKRSPSGSARSGASPISVTSDSDCLTYMPASTLTLQVSGVASDSVVVLEPDDGCVSQRPTIGC